MTFPFDDDYAARHLPSANMGDNNVPTSQPGLRHRILAESRFLNAQDRSGPAIHLEALALAHKGWEDYIQSNGTSQRRQPKYAKPPKYPGMSVLGADLTALRVHGSKPKHLDQFLEPEMFACNQFDSYPVIGDAHYHDNVMAEIEALCAQSSQVEGNSDYSHTVYGSDMEDKFSVDLPMNFFPDIMMEDAVVNNVPPDPSTVHPSMTVTGAALLNEVRAIYCDLVRSENHLAEAVEDTVAVEDQLLIHSSFRTNARDHDGLCRNTETLENAYRDAWNSHHDFYLAAQHPNAPDGLKNLAERYQMPRRLWEQPVREVFDILYRHFPDSWTQISSFVDYARHQLDQLKANVPAMAEHWQMIEENINQYVLHLNAEGFEVPGTHMDNMLLPNETFISPSQGGPTTEHGFDHAPDPRMTFHPSSAINLEPHNTANILKSLYPPNLKPLRDSILCFMAGWMCFGAQIAQSLRCYYETFNFLAQAGAVSE